MALVSLIGIVDQRGWVLLQERDEHAPVDPDRWSLVGGSVEPTEHPTEAAHRELAEETGIRHDLVHLGDHAVPCVVHGEDLAALYTARTALTDADVTCGEGRQIVFVDPHEAVGLDLTDATRALLPAVLAQP